MKVRTRIAPSPTGEYHVGGIRTALYNFALAKQQQGQFVVRIEDTDRERFVEGATERILSVMRRYGLDWDEGPEAGGEYGPYIQSERLPIYQEYVQKLIDNGNAYYCFLTSEETKELQELARKAQQKFRSPYRDKSVDEAKKLIEQGKSHVIRLRVPESEDVSFDDAVLGTITINTREVDDQVLLKSDGYPTYHLAVVVDDHLMQISHVMRGSDWLSSTPKHILLYRAFDWEMPIHAHLPNLKELGSTKKLSKRFGPVSGMTFLEEGYLPEALINFLMFLGWNPGTDKELYTLEEFVADFDIAKIHKTDLVVFDRVKLLWYNGQYIMQKSAAEFTELVRGWVKEFGSESAIAANILADESLEDKLKLVQERSKTLKEAVNQLGFFYIRPTQIDWQIKQLAKVQDQLGALREKIKAAVASLADDASTWQHSEWETAMRAIGDEAGIKHGDVFMVLRVAVVGAPFSPPLFESLQILGKTEVLSRLD